MTISAVEVLRAACCVAGLTGEVHEAERVILQRLAFEAGVGRASLHAMIERARTDRNFYREQFRYISADPEATIRTLLEVAAADGEMTTEQRVILHFLADKLKLPEARFDEMLVEHKRQLGSGTDA